MQKRGMNEKEVLWLVAGILVVGITGMVLFFYYGNISFPDFYGNDTNGTQGNNSEICSLTEAVWSTDYVYFEGFVDLIVNADNCDGEYVTFTIFNKENEIVNSKENVEIVNNISTVRWDVSSTNPSGIVVVLLIMPLLFSAFIIIPKKGITLHSHHLFAISISIGLIAGLLLFLVTDANFNNERKFENVFIEFSVHEDAPYYFSVTLESDPEENIQSGLLDIGDVPIALCGNGLIDGGEECDDGNDNSGDGCSLSCEIESGWSCSDEPSICVETELINNCDFRILEQGKFLTPDQFDLVEDQCMTNNAMSMHSSMIKCKADTLEEFLDETENSIRNSVINYLSSKGIDASSTDFFLLNCEGPAHPRNWGQWNDDLDTQNAIFEATKMRIDIVREELPNALIAIGPSIRGHWKGNLIDAIANRIVGVKRAGEYGVFDNLDCLEPRGFIEDIAYVEPVTRQIMDASYNNFTNSAGERMSACVTVSYTEDKIVDDVVVLLPPEISIQQLDIIDEYDHVLMINWWGDFNISYVPQYIEDLDLCNIQCEEPET